MRLCLFQRNDPSVVDGLLCVPGVAGVGDGRLHTIGVHPTSPG